MSEHDGTPTTGTEETSAAEEIQPATVEEQDDQILIDGEPILVRWETLLTKHILALNSGLSLAASFDWLAVHTNIQRDTLDRLRWDDWKLVQRYLLDTIQARNAPPKRR